ncbi:MAG TPA: glycosyltransferase family 4 protein [Candidatus Saccharimonadales bacterium]|nr:glycosyltransferase family 4 protein [Candidatus Saccharimonadales bacterium]
MISQNKPLKIALVYDAIYPFVKGGAERRFYEMGRRLAQSGHDVHWYGMQFWDGPSVIEYDGMTLHGIMKARPLYAKNGKRVISQAVLFGLASIKLLKEDFDVMDCCGFPYFSLFPAKLAAVIRRKPLYTTWHEVWGRKSWDTYLGPLGFVGYTVEKLASMLPDHIIACSELTADRLKDELQVKQPVTVIANGIDVAAMLKLQPSTDSYDLAYVGRLMAHKNVDMLLRAVHLLKKRGVMLNCVIIGDGPEAAALHALATRLRIQSQITWTGFIEASDEVYAIVKATKVFVLPSEREGFGMVALEANACGVPVLTLDHSDNATRHLITPGDNGALFPKDVAKLADAIQKLRQADDTRLRRKSRASARQFDWSALTAKAKGVYAS